MDLIVTLVRGFQPVTNITKNFILNVAGELQSWSQYFRSLQCFSTGPIATSKTKPVV